MSINLRGYLGDRGLYKQMFRIAIPISAQSLITVGINLMDTLMLSSMGDAQLSASSLASQFITFFMICCMGIGMGASVLTNRYWGMKEIGSLKKALTIMMRFSFCFGALFTVVTLLFPENIMRLFSSDPEIIHYGVIYLRWMVPTFFCMGFGTTTMVVLRGVRQVKVPLITSITAFCINLFFNWVFIFGNLGAPRMEIGGAALATLISRIVEVCIICGYLFFVDKKIQYRFRDLKIKCRDMYREYIKISIPVLISDGLLALGNTAVAIVMGHIGTTFVAANSVTMVVQQISNVLAVGIGNASGIITGHTMGEGDFDRAQRQGYTFIIIGFIIGIFAAVLITILKKPVIDFYRVSPEAKLIAADLMNAISFITIFQAVSSILTEGVLRAGGDTRFLMAGDILFLWVVSVPFGALAGLVFKWPEFWIYTLLKIDQVIKCIWCIFRLHSRKWMKKIEAR